MWSIGSAAAGLWYGSRSFGGPLSRRFLILLAVLSAGYAAWTLMPNSYALGALLFVSGAVIAPALTVEAELVSKVVPERMLNEAYTWLTTTPRDHPHRQLAAVRRHPCCSRAAGAASGGPRAPAPAAWWQV